MVTSLGLRAAARELGISHVALLKAEKTGRVKKSPDGKFDVEACRRSLELNSHPVQSRVARLQRKQPAPEAVEPVAPPAADQEPVDAPADGSIAEAARQLEWEKLREKRLKIDREESRLVDVAAVNSWVAGMIMKARDELVRIGPELRDSLGQETDGIKCEAMVTDRIMQALEKLSEYKPA